MDLAAEVKQKIEAALPGAQVAIVDFSHEHIGHGAPGAHLEVVVIYSGFKDLSLVEQHQKIYKILNEEFKKQVIHALRIKTKVA